MIVSPIYPEKLESERNIIVEKPDEEAE